MIDDEGDLTLEVLADVLPGRPLRAYPAMLSTEADAMAWARSGGPSGAVVVAGYQASARGRAGRPWAAPHGRSLGFSLLLRPQLNTQREGWLYLVVATALAHLLDEASIAWPDAVHGHDHLDAQLAVHCETGPNNVRWVVISCLLAEAPRPHSPLLAAAVNAIEWWVARDADTVLAVALQRCETLGRRVRARMLPMGPRGVVIEGTAVEVTREGSLVVETGRASRRAVRPQDLGVLEVE